MSVWEWRVEQCQSEPGEVCHSESCANEYQYYFRIFHLLIHINIGSLLRTSLRSLTPLKRGFEMTLVSCHFERREKSSCQAEPGEGCHSESCANEYQYYFRIFHLLNHINIRSLFQTSLRSLTPLKRGFEMTLEACHFDPDKSGEKSFPSST